MEVAQAVVATVKEMEAGLEGAGDPVSVVGEALAVVEAGTAEGMGGEDGDAAMPRRSSAVAKVAVMAE